MPTPSTNTDEQVGLNLVVLRGRLSRDPALFTLPSGDVLANLEVTTRLRGASAETVPVVVVEPSAAVLELQAGELVVVTGRVQRRFFRAGGATQSRTRVTADRVVRARHKGRSRAAIDRAVADLLPAPDADGGPFRR